MLTQLSHPGTPVSFTFACYERYSTLLYVCSLLLLIFFTQNYPFTIYSCMCRSGSCYIIFYCRICKNAFIIFLRTLELFLDFCYYKNHCYEHSYTLYLRLTCKNFFRLYCLGVKWLGHRVCIYLNDSACYFPKYLYQLTSVSLPNLMLFN